MKRIHLHVLELLRHGLVSVLCAAIAVGPATAAFAAPQGAVVVKGNVTFTHVEGTQVWTIKAPNGSIIRYSGLDVLPGETVVFDQGSANARVLNRIRSAQPTKIDGTLQADGIVYIVNPAGVYFGDGATVNVAGLQAAAGNLSNRDFLRGDDHYTGLKGNVQNAGTIAANAVALVGRGVVNSDTITARDWIVLAAGKDVFIGRDPETGNGILLRVEGGADAVFNKSAVGVTNTGTLAAPDAQGQPTASTAQISLGAGDLYGTAIFSTGAIKAREIALQANNQGNVALGGTVHADDTLDVTLGGDKSGSLVAAGAGPHELDAKTLNLSATGKSGQVDVADHFDVRGADGAAPPESINVDQKATLTTSKLANLDIGTAGRAGTTVSLSSTGNIEVDDRVLVSGTKLELDSAENKITGDAPLEVDTLHAHGFTHTDADLIADGVDKLDTSDPNNPFYAPVMSFSDSLELGTRSTGTLLQAKNGTFSTNIDITTTDGGDVRIAAGDVRLGSKNTDGVSLTGGTILTTGNTRGNVTISAVDSDGTGHLTGSVQANAITTTAAPKVQGVDTLPGGDVKIDATGDVSLFGDVTTNGGAGLHKTDPRHDGGDVALNAGGVLTVHSIVTGGGSQHGAIALGGQEIVLRGDLDALAHDTNLNTHGERNREVALNGPVTLGDDLVGMSGGTVTTGSIKEEHLPDPNDANAPGSDRATALTINADKVTLNGDATVGSLEITTSDGPVLFGGDVTANNFVDVRFKTGGVARWGTTGSAPVIVKADSVSVQAGGSTATPPDGTAGAVALDDTLHFDLNLPTDANDPRPVFSLWQGAAIDKSTTDMLFTPDRFVGTQAGKTIKLQTNSDLTFDASALPAVQGTDLVMVGKTFTAAPGTRFDVDSFELSTIDALSADFSVTAHGQRDDQGIGIRSGVAGVGQLTVNGALAGRAILLASGDGLGSDGLGGGGAAGRVTVGATARFSNAAGDAAPDVFGIQQDAALNTTDAPGASQFLGPIAGMQYRLESLEGGVTLGSGAAAKLQGTDLFLNGETGIDLGADPLTLAGLQAETRGSLAVTQAITVDREDGKIDLRAAEDGEGTLSIGATLTADNIDLTAGNGKDGSTTAAVNLQTGQGPGGGDAKFAGWTNGAAGGAPEHFSMTQDATLTAADLPDRQNDFLADPTGMDLVLRSLGGDLTASSELVSGTALTLEGKTSVKIPLAGQSLSLLSLSAKGPTTLDGSVTTTGGDLKIDGTLELNAPAVGSTPTSQSLVAQAGALAITGATTKTTAGDVSLRSGGAVADGTGGELSVGDVATVHGDAATGGPAGRIDIQATGALKTGALDASGVRAPGSAPAVSVVGQSSVDVGSVDTKGVAGARNGDGLKGGDVVVTGESVVVGSIDTSGGSGGTATFDQPATRGGDAGSIALTATGADPRVGLRGELVAEGGAGQVRDPNAPVLRGNGGAVQLNGSLLLDLNASTAGGRNTIRGDTVAITGAVLTGTELDADGKPKTIPESSTSLGVVAENASNGANGISIGGDITAGRLDLEVHHGGLDLGTKTIHSDTIRLAATDGKGGDQNGEVANVDQLTFVGATPGRRITSLTLEQDKGFGGAGSAIPDVRTFTGDATGVSLAVGLGLISQDGEIVLDAAHYDNVKGSRLLLAANGAPGSDPNAAHVHMSGATGTGSTPLELQSLALGSVLGVTGNVNGNAVLDGDLQTGGLGLDVEALRQQGNFTVNGDASVKGSVRFAGTGDQTLAVTGGLELGGDLVLKSTTGKLTINADHIDLTAPLAQTIANDSGALVIGAPLRKGSFQDLDGDGHPDPVLDHKDPNDPNSAVIAGGRGLTLRGVASSSSDPGVTVSGAQRIIDDPNSPEYAIAISNGNLFIIADSSASTGAAPVVGTYQLGGDVLAFGDIGLSGEGVFKSDRPSPSYTVEALRHPTDLAGKTSGELTMGGVASADGDLRLVARGDNPTPDVQHPAGIHLQGNFDNLAGGLELDGTVDFAEDTSIAAKGDVTFDATVQGTDKSLTVSSGGRLALFDDVTMSGGALSLSGDKGVYFVSTNDTQFLQAGSISLGGTAGKTPSGAATLVRDGNLTLQASKGDVAVANGQRMVVNGSLDVAAPKKISLTDTAALRISLVSHDLIVRGGSSLIANSIVSAARPQVTGSSVATFAVPTRTEVSDNIPGDQVLLRQINADGSPLSLDSAFAGGEGPLGETLFPQIPFPPVTGPAQFDYARQTPLPPVRRAITRPHADPKELEAALAERPLWAEELLVYLQGRSLETPDVAPAAERLPPVGARPGDPLESDDRRVRSAAAEQAVVLYRELFRPNAARDPETGFVDSPSRAAAIREAFQAPVDVLRRGNHGQAVSGTALRDLIQSSSSYAPAQSYSSQIDQLLAAGELALTADQKPRFRALVLAGITPYGIAPTEFETALR